MTSKRFHSVHDSVSLSSNYRWRKSLSYFPANKCYSWVSRDATLLVCPWWRWMIICLCTKLPSSAASYWSLYTIVSIRDHVIWNVRARVLFSPKCVSAMLSQVVKIFRTVVKNWGVPRGCVVNNVKISPYVFFWLHFGLAHHAKGRLKLFLSVTRRSYVALAANLWLPVTD